MDLFLDPFPVLLHIFDVSTHEQSRVPGYGFVYGSSESMCGFDCRGFGLLWNVWMGQVLGNVSL